MTTTNNNTNANNVNNNESAQKPKALRYLANDAAKMEMFSLKGATNSVKSAYDNGDGREYVREYMKSLGFSANAFKALKWEELQEFATTKSGKYSTYAVICALKKYSDAHDLTGEFAAKQARKEERAKAAEAKKRIEEQKRAEREKAKAEREQKAAQHVAVEKARTEEKKDAKKAA